MSDHVAHFLTQWGENGEAWFSKVMHCNKKWVGL